MASTDFVSSDTVRTLFSRALSDMYRAEVPQYGTLLDLVAAANVEALTANPPLADTLRQAGEVERLSEERHGAVRLGTADELRTIARLFAIMGMHPVGYYDLSVAGVPVHSTAFRPISDEALRRNPFRVFTSLLRLELIEDRALRRQAEATLERRRIFTPALLALLDRYDETGGLTQAEAHQMVAEALETFRWHDTSTVDAGTYRAMHDAHRLVADVVCFRGPHVNHLTPRTLDIDHVQRAMAERGMTAKATIEGPPRRACPILLRQTSFKALEESIRFPDENGCDVEGSHTARFGEIEQRGVALTPKGRALYDRLLAEAQAKAQGQGPEAYGRVQAEVFAAFPDDYDTMDREGLAFFRRSPVGGTVAGGSVDTAQRLDARRLDPITYEDFLPVSAAGIFQSNLGESGQETYGMRSSKLSFEAALGRKTLDEMALYRAAEQALLAAAPELT